MRSPSHHRRSSECHSKRTRSHTFGFLEKPAPVRVLNRNTDLANFNLSVKAEPVYKMSVRNEKQRNKEYDDLITKLTEYREKLEETEVKLNRAEDFVDQLKRKSLDDDISIRKYETRIQNYEQKLMEVKRNKVKDSLICNLIQACEDVDIPKISYCLKLNVDLNGKSENTTRKSGAALFALIGSDKIEAVGMLSLLLKRGDVDVNITDNLGNTPLIQACSRGNIAAVRILCKSANIDVNWSNNFKNTALIQAVRGNHVGIVEFFSSDVPAMDWNKNSPLIDAVQEGNVGLVELFLSVPGVDLRGVAGAAVRAEEGDSLGCVQLLSEDPRISWTEESLEDGYSPLTYALQHDRTEIVSILLNIPNMDISGISHPRHIEMTRRVMCDQVARLNKRLRAVPECPVCLKTFHKDRSVYQCEAGHFVCQDCFQHPSIQRSCTVCRSNMIGRAHGFEHFLQQMF